MRWMSLTCAEVLKLRKYVRLLGIASFFLCVCAGLSLSLSLSFSFSFSLSLSLSLSLPLSSIATRSQ